MRLQTSSSAKLSKLVFATIMVTTLSTTGCDLKIDGGSLNYTIGTEGSELSLTVGGDITFGASSQISDAERQTANPVQEACPSVKPILNLIGRTEGTDRGDGYNETLAYGAFVTAGDVILTAMTLSEIDALQTDMLAHPRNFLNSSAIGRYQITRTSLRTLKSKLALGEDVVFTAALQDRLALELLKRRGLDAWRAGKIDDREFALNLAKEWASLPNPSTGKGYYPGQKAAVDYATVEGVLKASK